MAIIHYEIPDDLHRALKIKAAEEGKTLKQVILDALEAWADARRTKEEAE